MVGRVVWAFLGVYFEQGADRSASKGVIMTQRHKHADVIIAWAEGKDVQVWDDINDMWDDVTAEAPTFMGKKYRIKPPAKKYRVALFKDVFSGNIHTNTVDIQKDAEFYEKNPAFVRWLTDWVEYEG